MSMLDQLKIARESINTKNIAEDMAYFVMHDLEKAGFQSILVKPHEKKPKTWRIIPKDELDEEQMKEYQRLKEERVDYWRDQAMEQLRKTRKAMLG